MNENGRPEVCPTCNGAGVIFHSHHCPDHNKPYQCERSHCAGGLVYVCQPCEQKLITEHEERLRRLTLKSTLSAAESRRGE